MQSYESKSALIAQIERTAALFIDEFASVEESDRDLLLVGVDRTPAQMIAYQLGWLELLVGWDADEASGRPVEMPAKGFRWNRLGDLYQSFYDAHASCSLSELQDLFGRDVAALVSWLEGIPEEDIFTPGTRAWASSTPSNWPIWKWVHINSVAPFKSFRAKIRKWKRLRAAA